MSVLLFLHLLPLELFVYLRLIIGILSFCTSAPLTVLPLSNPALNLTFSLLPITTSHPHASASDSTLDVWRYINIWLTLTLLRCTDCARQTIASSVPFVSVQFSSVQFCRCVYAYMTNFSFSINCFSLSKGKAGTLQDALNTPGVV